MPRLIHSMRLTIDGETFDVHEVLTRDTVHQLTLVVADTSEEFYLAADAEAAGAAAEQYWRDMAANDPAEFRCIVGDDNILAMALGQGASPGSIWCDTLEEWFKLNATVPAEQWAGYDSEERTVDAAGTELVEALGFSPTVAYRHN